MVMLEIYVMGESQNIVTSTSTNHNYFSPSGTISSTGTILPEPGCVLTHLHLSPFHHEPDTYTRVVLLK